MYDRGLRYRIATSTLTLPVAAVAALAAWILPDVSNGIHWAGLGLFCITAYLMLDLVNRYSLIRIRSRLTTSALLLLTAACPFLHAASWASVAGSLLLLSYLCLFRTYQSRHATAHIFHAFVCLGIAAQWFPFMVCLIPVYYLSMLTQFRSFGMRSFGASLLGFSVPYWFVIAYYIWYDSLDVAWNNIKTAYQPVMPDYSLISNHQFVSAAFLTAVTLIAILHLFRTAYNDKIQVRMAFYFLAMIEAMLLILMCFMPHEWDALLLLLIINSSPVIAHYFALARGGIVNFCFALVLLGLATLSIYNQWTPSYSFL